MPGKRKPVQQPPCKPEGCPSAPSVVELLDRPDGFMHFCVLMALRSMASSEGRLLLEDGTPCPVEQIHNLIPQYEPDRVYRSLPVLLQDGFVRPHPEGGYHMANLMRLSSNH